MRFKYLLIQLILCISAGCQLEYEPLNTPQDSLDTRTLNGAMATQWQQDVEPLVQDHCIACHSPGDALNTGVSFSPAPLENIHDNLSNLLLVMKDHKTLNMGSPHHNALTPIEQSYLATFEIYASQYWGWRAQIEKAQILASEYFIQNIDNSIVQPICGGCHLFLEGTAETLTAGLSFYNYKVENHSQLNSKQALNYLIEQSQAFLLHDKAIGINHGGSRVIQNNSINSEHLLQHGRMVQTIITLSNNPPY